MESINTGKLVTLLRSEDESSRELAFQVMA